MAKHVLQVLALLAVLLLFFVSLELMGSSFGLLGEGFAEALLATTANPFVGLFIGVLVTAVVQSSSTVTSMVVGLVAGGGLTVTGAVPIIMGANVGTSVTNALVSLGHITRREEFRRAIAGATVHDFFNLLAVLILFPLELTTRALSRLALELAEGVVGLGGADLLSPLKAVTGPIVAAVIRLAGESGPLVLVLGVAGLFVALRYLVKLLRALLFGRSERLLHKYVFGKPMAAMLFGALITVMVQSSSITTSVMVPLVGAGIVTVAQIFPFVLGANVGTTITSILAALVLVAGGGPAGTAALNVALAHLLFNVLGVLIIYPFPPIRRIPIRLAEGMGNLAAKSRAYPLAFIALTFFVIPLVVIFATRGLDTSFYHGADPRPSVEERGGSEPGPEADSLPAPLRPAP